MQMENSVKIYVDNLPQGAIILWYGSIGNIPVGWSLCNGQKVGEYLTPNLVGRLVVGADVDSKQQGQCPKGNDYGSKKIELKNLPPHNHNIEFKPNVDSKISQSKLMAKTAYNQNIETKIGATNVYDRGGIDGNAIDVNNLLSNSITNNGNGLNGEDFTPFSIAIFYIIKTV
jgi:microcystin-dependent protein